ncbi:MAG: MBL fold metallo-hydrolase [Candidatus Omnitrophota bacterium]|nr:MAG: MBL fold metallo-hydrolase [Candidatus Omnitrophota bacterium]
MIKRLSLFFLIASIVVVSVFFFLKEEPLYIHFVGLRGESILIKKGPIAVVIDAGSFSDSAKLADYLRGNNLKNLEHVIITHPDPDHMGGVFALLSAFDVTYLYDNGQKINPKNWLERELFEDYGRFVREDPRYKSLNSPQKIRVSKDIEIEVLWPSSADTLDFNRNSLILLLKYKEFKILFTADSHIVNEPEFIEKFKDLGIDILKVPHHAKEGALEEKILKVFAPKLAVICAPKKDISYTSSVLEKEGVAVYIAKLGKDIVISINERMELK